MSNESSRLSQHPQTKEPIVPGHPQKIMQSTNNDGHCHDCAVDANGNGETNYRNGHKHMISGFNIQPHNSHRGHHGHNLISPGVFKRGAREHYSNEFDEEGLGFNQDEIYQDGI